MSKKHPKCLLCNRVSENFLRVSDNSNGENVEVVLLKHFPFQATDFWNEIVCSVCWKKIVDFHELFCEVEKRWTLGRFRCELCVNSKAFNSDGDLQIHNLMHHSQKENKILNCDQCVKTFATEWQLSSHKTWHQEVLSLNIYCNICNKQFASMHTRNAHIRKHHTEIPTVTPGAFSVEPTSAADGQFESILEPSAKETNTKKAKSSETKASEDELIRRFCNLSCLQCEYTGENLYQLLKHYQSEHETRGYAECCGQKFTKKPRLFNHCQLHINPDMFRCEACNKSFAQSEGLEQHNQWVHTPDSEKPFKCNICEAAFCKNYQLSYHMKRHVAKEQKIFHCDDCNKSFSNSLLLRAHQQKHHGASSNWVCDVCAKGFVHKALLEKHRLSHTAEGVASLMRQCSHCNKWLKNKDTYQSHIKRCMASGPVECDICGKLFSHEPGLMQHKRIMHMRERPLMACHYCDKTFKEIRRLKEHEANHRGVVLYTCPYCPKTSNSSSTMHNHKKTSHAEQWAAKRST
ncbi:zinc finger protein ZFP2-like [Wyeomyia smithii]|uniref:zinc finger protein ZFP2-like n=1 Tax=Wyeomyia smithii TaxID=174621 RepID=UPI00246816D2|nr:zinc finger protein ZFP2-like [Wyeomyia smithii]